MWRNPCGGIAMLDHAEAWLGSALLGHGHCDATHCGGGEQRCEAVAVHCGAWRWQSAVGYGKQWHGIAPRCTARAELSGVLRRQCGPMHSFGTAMLCSVQAQHGDAGLWQCTAVQRDGKVRRYRATAVRRKDMRRHSNAVLSAGMACKAEHRRGNVCVVQAQRGIAPASRGIPPRGTGTVRQCVAQNNQSTGGTDDYLQSLGPLQLAPLRPAPGLAHQLRSCILPGCPGAAVAACSGGSSLSRWRPA